MFRCFIGDIGVEALARFKGRAKADVVPSQDARPVSK